MYSWQSSASEVAARASFRPRLRCMVAPKERCMVAPKEHHCVAWWHQKSITALHGGTKRALHGGTKRALHGGTKRALHGGTKRASLRCMVAPKEHNSSSCQGRCAPAAAGLRMHVHLSQRHDKPCHFISEMIEDVLAVAMWHQSHPNQPGNVAGNVAPAPPHFRDY